MNREPEYEIGLVLGGGGARGFAHLGAVQAMLECGLKPDIISGTSAGAIIGAMLATGRTPKECLDFFLGKKLLHFARPAVSKKGILSLSNFEEELKEFLAVKRFEELKIPLVVTAGDIANAIPVHFEKGDLLSCVIASSSIPVVFTPREINRVDYVDGGVFMNLPVRPIRHRCKQVIAVEINSVSTSEKITNMLGMAVRSFHLSLSRTTDIDRSLCDILIAPYNLTQYSVLSLDHIHEIYTAGYLTGKEVFQKNKLLQGPSTLLNL